MDGRAVRCFGQLGTGVAVLRRQPGGSTPRRVGSLAGRVLLPASLPLLVATTGVSHGLQASSLSARFPAVALSPVTGCADRRHLGTDRAAIHPVRFSRRCASGCRSTAAPGARPGSGTHARWHRTGAQGLSTEIRTTDRAGSWRTERVTRWRLENHNQDASAGAAMATTIAIQQEP